MAPSSQYCHDWMHTTCSAGLLQLLLFLLFSDVAKAGVSVWSHFKEYLETWTFPSGQRCHKLSELFAATKVEAYKKAHTFKCQASEMRTLYVIVRQYCFTVLMPHGICAEQIAAFLAMFLGYRFFTLGNVLFKKDLAFSKAFFI